MYVPLARWVEAVGGLVEHEQARLGEQGGGEAEPLPHSEGEATRLVVGDVGEPDLLEDVVDARRRCVATAQAGQRGEVAPGGQRGVETGAVDEARDTFGHRLPPPDRRAQDLKAAAVRQGQAKQNAKQRRLPRAVRADDPVDLPSFDIQVDTVERDDTTETFRESASTHRAGTTHQPSSSPPRNPQGYS